MRRSVSVGELLTASLTVIGAILGFWINTNVRLAVLEKADKQHQDANIEMKSDLKSSFNSLGEQMRLLTQGQNDIKVILQNKQDRK